MQNTTEHFLGHDGYEAVPNLSEEMEPSAKSRNRPSPVPASNSLFPSPPPPVPTSPRPFCLSPETDRPPSISRYHSHVEPSVFHGGSGTSGEPLLLSLPRTSARHLSKSQDNLHSDPSYERIPSLKRSTNNLPGSSNTSPFFAQGFSLSDSDSDLDEFEPQLLRRSPQGLNQGFSNLGSLPSSGSGTFYSSTSAERVNRYHTHPSSSLSSTSPPYYQTHQHLLQQKSATLTTSSSSAYGTTSRSGGGGPPSLSMDSRSIPTGAPSNLSSIPSQSSTTGESLPRVSVQNPHSDAAAMESLKPLTTGMAGKIHFYTDLDAGMLLLLQNTERGKIPGVRYEPDTGQVQIESDSSEKTKLASEKFRAAYVYATANMISLAVDVPGDVTESTVEEIISAQVHKYGQSTVSYDGMESSLQVLSFSGGELVRLQQALQEAIQKAAWKSSEGFSLSGNITGRTRLSIKKGNVGSEDTDVIVFPNTSNLACKEGVAKAVDDLSQGAVLRQCKSFIAKHGLLGFGETILMKGGSRVRAKYVVHVNPGVGSSINLESIVRKLVAEALKAATSKSATSIAFCPLVSTWTEANIEVVARAMFESIRQFVNERKGRKIRDVRIVVREQAAFECFNKFAKLS